MRTAGSANADSEARGAALRIEARGGGRFTTGFHNRFSQQSCELWTKTVDENCGRGNSCTSYLTAPARDETHPTGESDARPHGRGLRPRLAMMYEAAMTVAAAEASDGGAVGE